MKRINLFIAMVLICSTIVGINSCKKSTTAYKCSTCATGPEALAANDNSSKGIYKGVVVGSSGTIKFDIMNNGSTITAVMVIDGSTVNLTSTFAWVSGQPVVAPFTGTLNGQAVSITFSIDLSGGNPTVSSINIPGHANAVLSVFKETSNSQVVCFEGTYSGTESGTFNLILSTGLGAWGAVAKETDNGNGNGKVSNISGAVSNNQLTCVGCSNGSNITATLSGDEITNGKWTDDKSGSGTWTGKKTL